MSEIVDCIAWIVRKTCWSFFVFFKFLLLRLLDLFGLILNIAACCTIVRLPFMIAHFVHMDSFIAWRTDGLIQLLIFIMDIPIIIMGIIIILTMWRVYPCGKELAENWSGRWNYGGIYFSGMKVRYVIVKHFFTLFIDMFCVPSAIVCLLSWRCVIFVRKIQKANNDWDRRKVCFKQFLQVLLDIPLLVCFMIALLSWRLPSVIKHIQEDIKDAAKWNDIRFIGIEHLFYLLLDIPCIITFLITLLTWRSPILIWQLHGSCSNILGKTEQRKLRKIVLLQFLYVFVDVPSILAAIFVTVTLWRLPTLVKKLKKVFTSEYNKMNFYKKEFNMRQYCLTEFGMVLVDLICFIMTVLLLLTLWRAFPLISDIKKYFKRYRNSKTKSEAFDRIPTEDNKSGETPAHSTDYGTFSGEDNNEEHAVNQTAMVPNVDEAEDLAEDGQDNVNSNDLQTDDIEAEHDILTLPELNEISLCPDDDKKHTLSWSKCMWKIRKAVALHVVMLFIDIPAIPLSLFLMVTIIRTSKLLSALLGSGNFYMLFAVTVYYQTLRFFIDLLFLLLFLVLMLLRPVQSWVHLLEDEEHMKYRLLCDIIVWAPDIAADRHTIYEKLSDVLMMDIKQNESENRTRSKLKEQFDSHLDRIEDLLEKLQDHEIEDEFVYLVQCVKFYENKRVGKLMRKYEIEVNYLQRTDPNLHKDNLFRYSKEMREYENIVKQQHEKLINYKPDKVPLYETKSGFSLRSRQETRNVLIKCLPRGRFLVVLMALFCCLPLYRAPSMIKKLFQRWYNRFGIVVKTLKEYALDLLTLLRILVVLLFVYRAPIMLADIVDCLIEKRSWKAVRKIVKDYPSKIVHDIIDLFIALLSWQTPRFIFTAILFGLLMPADLFLTVIRICVTGKCIGYIVTLLLYFVFMGFPFIVPLYAGKELLEYGLGWVNVVLICGFSAMLLFTLLLMVMALIKDRKKTFLLQMPECDYVRLSWYNIHIILFEILEFLQAIALIFKLTSIPMYGGSILNTASSYLLFSFMPFKAIFWITVVVFIVWFLLCGAPIIFENILGDFPVGTCGGRASWRLAVSLFANTLFVTMIENFISFSACQYETCPSNYTLGHIPINTSCLTSKFVEDESFTCWTKSHQGYAAFGLISLVWYTTTALIFDTKYGDPDTSEQDIGFSPVYNTVLNIFKAAMVVGATLITNSNYTVLSILLASNVLSILYTVGFHRLFGYYPSNLPSVLVWRVFTFVSGIIGTIAVITAFVMDEASSKIPVIILVVGTVVTFIVAFIIAVKLRRVSTVERDREEFREEIRQLEARLTKNKFLLKRWQKERSVWHRLIKSVREARKDDRHFNPDDWNIRDTKENMEENAVNGKETEELSATETFQNETATVPEDSSIPPNPPPPEESLIPTPPLPPPVPSYEETTCIEDSPPTYEMQERDTNYVSLAIPLEVQSVSGNVIKLEKNGRNLLLLLEKYTSYEAYRYCFLSQRNIWLNAVWNSNWTGLLHCLRILSSNLQGTYDQPTHIDIALSKPSLPTDKLEDDPQDQDPLPPVFQKQTKEIKEQISMECRRRALDNFAQFSNFGEEWSRLFDKLLPTVPVIKSWTYVEDASFELICRRPNTGTITEIDEKGNKLAKGASFTIPKILCGRLTSTGLYLDEGYEPVAKKGPVSVTLKQVAFITKKSELYLEANGKKVKYEVAMASCKTVKWN